MPGHYIQGTRKRAQQPQMWALEWNGDQFLPAIKDASLVYRKLHAYAFISGFLANKEVLEIAADDVSASGILAKQASSVVSLVTDSALAKKAAERYGKANLRFQPVSPAELGETHEQHFDAVIALDGSGTARLFPEQSLPVIKRLLKPDGVLVTSSPQRQTLQDVLRWLGPHFRSIEVLGEGVCAGSVIWALTASRIPVSTLLLSRLKTGELEIVHSSPDAASSLIAIASDVGPRTRDTGSILIDRDNELLADKDKVTRDLLEDAAARTKLLEQCEQQLAERRESLASLQEGFAWQQRQIASLTESRSFLEREIAHFRNAMSSNEEALKWRAAQVEELESRAVKLQELTEAHRRNLQLAEGELRDAKADLKAATDELHSIKTSAGWGVILRIRSVRDKLLPPGSSTYRLYERIMSSSRFRGGRS